MVMERVPAKISRIRWVLVVRFFLTGPELREHGEGCMERRVEMSPAMMKSLVRVDSVILGRGSWAVTCSVQFGDNGQIIAGKAGGETTHPSTLA